MKKLIITILLCLLLICSFGLIACDKKSEKIENDYQQQIEELENKLERAINTDFVWDDVNNPYYKDIYYLGAVLEIQEYKCAVDEKEVEVTITLTDPADEQTEVSVAEKINLTTAGKYTITYLAKSEDITSKKRFSFQVDDSISSHVWSVFGIPVEWCGDEEITLEGNVIRINKQIPEYKGIAFKNLNISPETYDTYQSHVVLSFTNNTTESVAVKYKVTLTNGDTGWGKDLTVAAGSKGSAIFRLFTDDCCDTRSPIKQVEIFIFTEAITGTLEIDLQEYVHKAFDLEYTPYY